MTSSPVPRRAAFAAATLALALGATACGSSGESGADAAASETTTVAPTTLATSTTATTAPVGTSPGTATSAPATTAAMTTPAPTTPTTTVAATPATTTSCTSVAHLGDSTSVGLVSTSFIPDPALQIGGQYARVGATDSRLEISGARSIVETLPGQVNARDTAAALKQSGFDGCWVLALGTTDTANVAVGSNITRAERIDRMMQVIGDDPVLWVDVKTLVTSGAWSNPEMEKWNQELAQAQARYPNIKVYHWTEVVQDGWFSSDRIHYTSEGYTQRARLIADALAASYPA
jgi:hypothetical protein